MNRLPTADPSVWIEEHYEGYTRYRNSEGRRWEVHGYCDRRGDCLIGAVIEGEAPVEVLLGMSFLNRVRWREEQGVLMLESKF